MLNFTDYSSRIKIYRYRFTCRAESDFFENYNYASAVRGMFGIRLKELSCVQPSNDNCVDCADAEQCAYKQLFFNQYHSSTIAQGQHNDAPRPYIIEPIETLTRICCGDVFHFHFSLIGKANQRLPRIIEVFRSIGLRGVTRFKHCFRIMFIESLHSATESKIVFDNADLYSELIRPVQVRCPLSYPTTVQSVDLHFETPVCIKTQNVIMTRYFDFPTFVRQLFERFQKLYWLDAVERFSIDDFFASRGDEVAIANQNLAWVDWERESNRQKTRMKQGGLIGHISYRGDLSPFVPLICLGEHMHVGKNTAFGLGKFSVTGI